VKKIISFRLSAQEIQYQKEKHNQKYYSSVL